MISKAKNAYLALGVTSMLVAGSAMAALPASVATTVTAIETDGQAIFDLIFPVVGVFLGLAIVIKLFKRFSNKV
jgi:glycopeptide antibiotics resistance protein